MPNWKKSEDYEFSFKSKSEGRRRFCWEFMRRNPEYSSDYESTMQNQGPVYDPPKMEGESDKQWYARIIELGLDSGPLAPLVYYALKWGMQPPLQDPTNDEPPKFSCSYPKLIKRWDDITEFFLEESPDAPITVGPGYATLVFNLNEPMKEQSLRADILMKAHKAELEKEGYEIKASKPKSEKFNKWRIYLRLLDALSTGADNKEIHKHIEDYAYMEYKVDIKYPVSNKIGTDTKVAQQLVNNPLLILK